MQPLKKIKEIPTSLNSRQLVGAVRDFVQNSGLLAHFPDADSICRQTVDTIMASSVLAIDGSHAFWVYVKENNLLGYALTYIGKEADGQMSFWITQAWAHPSIRRSPLIKSAFHQLREEAKRSMCSHLILPSSRSPKAYMRLLGPKIKPYLVLLKEDLYG